MNVVNFIGLGTATGPVKPGLAYDIDRDKVEDLTLQRF